MLVHLAVPFPSAFAHVTLHRIAIRNQRRRALFAARALRVLANTPHGNGFALIGSDGVVLWQVSRHHTLLV
jgi:hypothetical protein